MIWCWFYWVRRHSDLKKRPISSTFQLELSGWVWSLVVFHCDFVRFSNMALSLRVCVPIEIMRAIPTPHSFGSVWNAHTSMHLFMLFVCMDMWPFNVYACMCCYFELRCCCECSRFLYRLLRFKCFRWFVRVSIAKLQLTMKEAENPSIWFWLVRFVWFHDSSYDLFTWTSASFSLHCCFFVLFLSVAVSPLLLYSLYVARLASFLWCVFICKCVNFFCHPCRDKYVCNMCSLLSLTLSMRVRTANVKAQI